MTADVPAPPGDPAALARQAAAAWGHPDAGLQQVGFGATAVFRLDRGTGRPMALRLHPEGLRSATIAIQRWTESLADAGFACPWPQRTPEGLLVPDLPGIVSSGQQWLGDPLRRTAPDDLAAAAELLADLHLTSDAVAPDDLDLPAIDPGAWDAPPALAPTAARAAAVLAAVPAGWRGPIHGDPQARRFVTSAGTPYLTGFGRAGLGPRVLDLAALILPDDDLADTPAALAARKVEVWDGYRTAEGPLPAEAEAALDAALLLTALRRARHCDSPGRRADFLRLAESLAAGMADPITRN